MPRCPIRFDFPPELMRANVENASRRRLLHLENAYPAAREWCVSLAPAPVIVPKPEAGFQARVCACLSGGERQVATGSGSDPLGALAFAFNELEARLEAEAERARQRAAEWLAKVRRRIAQRGA